MSEKTDTTKPKSTIYELERMLNSETEENITILPNGTIKKLRGKKKKQKVLTMRENLGGEYAEI